MNERETDIHNCLVSTIANALLSLRLMSMPRLDANVACNEDILETMKQSFEHALKLVKEPV